MEYKRTEDFLFKNVDVKERYGEKYVDHFLDQYKIYLSMLDNISDRRQKSNEFYLGINTVIIGALGYVETKGTAYDSVVFFIAPIVGILISYSWFQIINSYKNLNSAKFNVIHAIEQRLPMTMFETEWKLLEEGKNKKAYYPFTHIEIHIPQIFIGIYLILFLVNVPWWRIGRVFRCLF